MQNVVSEARWHIKTAASSAARDEAGVFGCHEKIQLVCENHKDGDHAGAGKIWEKRFYTRRMSRCTHRPKRAQIYGRTRKGTSWALQNFFVHYPGHSSHLSGDHLPFAANTVNCFGHLVSQSVEPGKLPLNTVGRPAEKNTTVHHELNAKKIVLN